jgi:6-phosphofructokinase
MAKKGAKKISKAGRGSRYTCKVCGLVVTIDNVCGCVEACDIICCGKQMEPKK